MSKNVAVFVDVANIFYAAKAAGIDIDYVTLLKSATANRDFVRAYAYTGLDPENENQRQFHAFLTRSGYKVVSKDIRKYGDGRMKANLDIELVVDMMRLAEKLDIAVVVSGDGDFAPAIAAVQQKGVRVEVLSFRGNTSSDLIDVADVFTDITHVAKVEKGVRSGRRVASDGDLSMTAVPEKELGVKPRRRRRGEPEERSERSDRTSRSRRRGASKPEVEPEVEETETAEVTAVPASLVALPGEKLSRGAEPSAAPATMDEPTVDAEDEESSSEDGSGRRRRRRRGGRGRGRGSRTAEDGTETSSEPEPRPDTRSHDDEVPPLPQHAGFGSVWDSQIGVSADTTPTSSGRDEEDEEGEGFEDEPEVAEYLLAEKKQGGRQGGRGGRGGRSGGYRSAIDRERYGLGGRSRSGSGSRGRSPSAPRASVHAMEPIEQTPGGDPWSEVPPDVQELLMAELARRGSGSSSAPAAPEAEATAEEEKPKQRTTRRRTTRKAETDAAAPAAEATAEEEKPKQRTTRRRTTRKAETDAAAPAAEATAEEEKPKQRTTRRRTTKTAETDAAAPAAEATAEEEKPKQRTTRRRTTKKAETDAAAADEA